MKKRLIKILAVCILGISANSSYAQLEEGDILVGANYGIIGGVKGFIFSSIEAIDTEDEISTRYLGPIGLHMQYMATPNFGIGLDANYTNRNAEWTEDERTSSYNSSTDEYETTTTKQKYSVNQSIIRLMVRTSWEFVNTEKLQVNWANSVGYRKATWTLSPTDYDEYEFLNNPLAFRTAVGMRYWFTENVGLNMEFGVGGGANVNTGISATF